MSCSLIKLQQKKAGALLVTNFFVNLVVPFIITGAYATVIACIVPLA